MDMYYVSMYHQCFVQMFYLEQTMNQVAGLQTNGNNSITRTAMKNLVHLLEKIVSLQ